MNIALLATGMFVLIMFTLMVISYIPFSLGIYRMALKTGVKNPWLAWIPLANGYVIGKIIKTLRIGNYQVPRPEITLALAPALMLLVGRIPIVGSLYGLALGLLYLMATYRLFLLFKRDSALLFTLLCLLPPTGAFLILSVSQYDPEA